MDEQVRGPVANNRAGGWRKLKPERLPGAASSGAYHPEPPWPGGGAGRLMQLGAGGEVRAAAPAELCPLVWTPTTRMSPAGMPCAFTVTDPLREMPVSVVIRWPRPDMAGAGSEPGLGHPGLTGTTTTCLSPSWRSRALAPAIPDVW